MTLRTPREIFKGYHKTLGMNDTQRNTVQYFKFNEVMIEKRRGQSATLDTIAADFGVSVRVFRAWMKEAGIQKGSSHFLKPKTLDAIYDAFGVPLSDS